MERLRRRLVRLYLGTINGRQLLEQFEAFPTVDLEAVTLGKPVLILAPHADDESLGCGGLIAEACRRGQVVHVVILSDGAASHPGSKAYPAAMLAALRQEETLSAAACLGLDAANVTFLGLPDGRLPQGFMSARAVAKQLSRIGQRIAATTILATWQFDMHRDHVATYRYGKLVAKALGAAFYAYPVWSLMLDEQAKLPAVQLDGVSLDVSSHLPAKHQAVMAHRSQTTRLITDGEQSFQLTPQQLETFITGTERYVLIKRSEHR